MTADLAHYVRRDIDPVMERHRRNTAEQAKTDLILSNFAENWLVRQANAGSPRSQRDVNILRNDVLRLLGDRRIDQLTVTDVDDFATTLGARAESARRTGVVMLKTLLNDAKRRNLIDRSPADAVPTPVSDERERQADDWEIQRYMEAAADVGGPRGNILETLMRMLKRKEAVAELTWHELKLDQGIWELPAARSKDRKDQTVGLPPQVIEIIRRQQPDPTLRTGFVFTLNGRTAPKIGSQVKDLLDANMHRRVQLANTQDGTSRTVEHFTVHDVRTMAPPDARDLRSGCRPR